MSIALDSTLEIPHARAAAPDGHPQTLAKTFAELGDMLAACAQREQEIFQELYQVSKSR